MLSKLTLPGTNADNIINEFVPGLLVITAFMEGLFVGYDMIDEVRNGVIERLRVTPTSRFALLAGRLLSGGIIWNVVAGEAVAILTVLAIIVVSWATHVFSRDIA